MYFLIVFYLFICLFILNAPFPVQDIDLFAISLDMEMTLIMEIQSNSFSL